MAAWRARSTRASRRRAARWRCRRRTRRRRWRRRGDARSSSAESRRRRARGARRAWRAGAAPSHVLRVGEHLLEGNGARGGNVLRRDEGAERCDGAEVLLLLRREEDVAEILPTPCPVMDAADVDLANATMHHELAHRGDVAREEDARPRIEAIVVQEGRRLGGGVEAEVHLGGHAHPIELTLPITRCDGIVDEHDEPDVERLPPADHDLAVNQAVIDPVEHEGHAGAPEIEMAARARSTAPRAASCASSALDMTKPSSMGRLVPDTSATSGISRSRRRAAMVQLPA